MGIEGLNRRRDGGGSLSREVTPQWRSVPSPRCRAPGWQDHRRQTPARAGAQPPSARRGTAEQERCVSDRIEAQVYPLVLDAEIRRADARSVGRERARLADPSVTTQSGHARNFSAKGRRAPSKADRNSPPGSAQGEARLRLGVSTLNCCLRNGAINIGVFRVLPGCGAPPASPRPPRQRGGWPHRASGSDG